MREPPIDKSFEPPPDHQGFRTTIEIHRAARAYFAANSTSDILSVPSDHHIGRLGHSLLPEKSITQEALDIGILVIRQHPGLINAVITEEDLSTIPDKAQRDNILTKVKAAYTRAGCTPVDAPKGLCGYICHPRRASSDHPLRPAMILVWYISLPHRAIYSWVFGSAPKGVLNPLFLSLTKQMSNLLSNQKSSPLKRPAADTSQKGVLALTLLLSLSTTGSSITFENKTEKSFRQFWFSNIQLYPWD